MGMTTCPRCGQPLTWSQPMPAVAGSEARLVAQGRCKACGREVREITSPGGIEEGPSLTSADALAADFCRLLDLHGASWAFMGVQGGGPTAVAEVPMSIREADDPLRVMFGTYLPTKIAEYDLRCIAACWTGDGIVDVKQVSMIFVAAFDTAHVVLRVATTYGVSWPARRSGSWEEADIADAVTAAPIYRALRQVALRDR